jgi:hypothetical protein
MNTTPDVPHTERHPNAVATIFMLVRSLAIFPVVMAAILFVVAGRLDWTWAWVYVGINLANVFIAGPITIYTNPVPVVEHE